VYVYPDGTFWSSPQEDELSEISPIVEMTEFYRRNDDDLGEHVENTVFILYPCFIHASSIHEHRRIHTLSCT
jgi:hypothetical protein